MAQYHDSRRLGDAVGKYPTAAHPAIAPLAPGSFADASPRFRTEMHVTPLGSGMAVLQWASDQFGVGPPGSQLAVGKLRFTLNSADSIMVALEAALGMPGTELNNVDVMPCFRGQDGGRLLVEAMRVELSARGVGFVMLRRLDRAGKTGLGSWYESMGIHEIHDVLPAEVIEAAIEDRDIYMIGLVDYIFPVALRARS